MRSVVATGGATLFAGLIRPLRKREDGFTLVELMIVILVILLLAALLAPQFGLAKERAIKAKCVSNQRNLETAVAMWSTDNLTTPYTGGTMDVSVPGINLATTSPQYTMPAFIVEPDHGIWNDGRDYYVSNGSASGAQATANQWAPSYGHVACAFDSVSDPWVGSYDIAGAGVGISHTRGASASP
jgi:general secretion pathway protein G